MIRSAFTASASALVLLGVPGVASAADPPSCESQGYDEPYLRIDGSEYARNTRYIKMRINPKTSKNEKSQSDVEYPFQLTVAPSNAGSHTYAVHSFPNDEFPVSFSKGETDLVTAKYVEVHTTWGLLGPTNNRCLRTVSATFKKPPRPRAQPRRGSGRRPNRGGGRGGRDDGEDRQGERDR